MKQKLLIVFSIVLLLGILVALNAASYAGREKLPDSELSPNRSTYNTGATGTRVFYDLLHETGRKVIRWQESPAGLLAGRTESPSVFVVAGELRREFESSEYEQLFKWVAAGGRLVVIDRDPPKELVTTTANWQLHLEPRNRGELLTVDPADIGQMTRDTAAVKPVQPTVLTSAVNAIQPSRYASDIGFERFADTINSGIGSGGPPPAAPPPPPPARSDQYQARDIGPMPKRPDMNDVASPSLSGPVVHFGSTLGDVVADAPFGEGRIVYVSDPFIYSNVGIGLADNMQFAINSVNAGGGLIAFDEYHQGFGRDQNRFLQFFAGTPIVAIFLQLVVLTGLVFFSRSRRFARPVPEPEPDRLSKLEYVSAMAELQERSRAYDLAIENIYSDFRRRTSRAVGVDNTTAGYDELARLIAERTGGDASELSAVMFKCEEIIRGEPTNKGEVLDLTAKLRVIENRLGLARSTGRWRPVHGR